VEASGLKRSTAVDEKTARLARQSVRTATAIDAVLAGVAKNATRSLPAMNQALVNETARTLNAFDTTKLVDALGMKRFSETVASALPRPAFGTSSVAAALAGFKVPPPKIPGFAEALGGIDVRPAFRFAKTIEDLGQAANMQELAKAVGAFDLPRPFAGLIQEALAHLPRDAMTGVVPIAEAALVETATLARSTAVAEVAEEALDEIDGMTLAERRNLQRDLLDAIAVVVTLIGILTKSQRIALVSCLVALLAVCLSIYWRLDKAEE
jgi:hypothetical protein